MKGAVTLKMVLHVQTATFLCAADGVNLRKLGFDPCQDGDVTRVNYSLFLLFEKVAGVR